MFRQISNFLKAGSRAEEANNKITSLQTQLKIDQKLVMNYIAELRTKQDYLEKSLRENKELFNKLTQDIQESQNRIELILNNIPQNEQQKDLEPIVLMLKDVGERLAKIEAKVFREKTGTQPQSGRWGGKDFEQKILNYLEEQEKASFTTLSRELDISSVTLSRHLRRMVEKGTLWKKQEGTSSIYHIVKNQEQKEVKQLEEIIF